LRGRARARRCRASARRQSGSATNSSLPCLVASQLPQVLVLVPPTFCGGNLPRPPVRRNGERAFARPPKPTFLRSCLEAVTVTSLPLFLHSSLDEASLVVVVLTVPVVFPP